MRDVGNTFGHQTATPPFVLASRIEVATLWHERAGRQNAIVGQVLAPLQKTERLFMISRAKKPLQKTERLSIISRAKKPPLGPPGMRRAEVMLQDADGYDLVFGRGDRSCTQLLHTTDLHIKLRSGLLLGRALSAATWTSTVHYKY